DGYAWAQKAGHTITELYPTEVALTSAEQFIKNRTLQGLSLRDVALTVLSKNNKPIITHQMDMVFTHFGISGPAVLRCSQFVVKEILKGREKVLMLLDILPGQTEDQLIDHIFQLIDESPRKSFKNILKGLIPERLLEYFLKKNSMNGEQNGANVSKRDIQMLVKHIKQFTFTVNG